MQQERAYFEALVSIAAYRATANHLEFKNADGEVILVFDRKLPPAVDLALEHTGWILDLLHGEKPLAGSHLTLNLGREGFDGFSGCNTYGGEYETASDGVLIVGPIFQTAMECESPALTEQERTYVEALRSSTSYRVSPDRLEIGNAAGETVLVFVRKESLAMNPDDLLGTAWQLASLNGADLFEGSAITLAFQNDHRVSGHAGCQDYVATYQAGIDDMSFLFFSMIEAGCSMEEALLAQEGTYTTLLGWASSYRLQEEQLEILTERGEVLLYEPLPEAADASLEGTPWVLSALVEETEVEGMAAPLPAVTMPRPGTQVTATFKDGHVGGSAGCNSYGAAYDADGIALHVETPEATEMDCLEPPGIMEQEQRYLDTLGSTSIIHIHYNQLWLETDDSRALVFAAPSRSQGMADLLAELRNAGLEVEATQEMVDHGFSIQGQRVLVAGSPVFVYEFADRPAADLAFAGISVDEYGLTISRTEGEVTVETHGDWIETPHVYKLGRLIVITGDHATVLDALEQAIGLQARVPGPEDCSTADAFPPEEAELIWPTLHAIQPDLSVPGSLVEIQGTGGFLYWNNECGEFRNESARDFQLFFDGEPLGSIMCYAHTCFAELAIPADATPGAHTISVEGGSSIETQTR
jgi:heat shock protein HslJ